MKKRIMTTLLIAVFMVAILAGCSSAKLTGFGNMSVKEIQQNAFKIAESRLGYSLDVTNYNGEVSTENGVKIATYVYDINGGYLQLYMGTDENGDYIYVYCDGTNVSDLDQASDEWLALLEGVLLTIDPQADWDEFDALFYYSYDNEYHDYYYYYFVDDYTLEMDIYPSI